MSLLSVELNPLEFDNAAERGIHQLASAPYCDQPQWSKEAVNVVGLLVLKHWEWTVDMGYLQ